MSYTATDGGRSFALTKIVAAIEHLEEPNVRAPLKPYVVNDVDHDAWCLFVRETIAFYRTRGMERLRILSRHNDYKQDHALL